MIDHTLLRTAAESDTEAAGASLGRSLHVIPVTIGLSGAIGVGKTSFMRGFLRGLGITGAITSPTYALEQRYTTTRGTVTHIDLYRLSTKEACEALRSSEDDAAIRCIEWPERAGDALHCDIHVTIEEAQKNARVLTISTNDVSWPDDRMINTWRNTVCLPENIRAHCDAVAEICRRIADALIERGQFVRREFLAAAGKTHDLFRFVDFRPDAAPPGYEEPQQDRAVWDAWMKTHPATSHEEAIGSFLLAHGFSALARTTAEHSIHVPLQQRSTIESHILYYADKRVIGDRCVTIDERYRDFDRRYRNGTRTEQSDRWEQDARDTERILFPEGAPF